MTREEELNLISKALNTSKHKFITPEEALEHDIQNQNLSSKEQRKRINRSNWSYKRLGTRSKSKFKEII